MSGGQRSKDGFQTYKVVVVVSVLEAQQQIPKHDMILEPPKSRWVPEGQQDCHLHTTASQAIPTWQAVGTPIPSSVAEGQQDCHLHNSGFELGIQNLFEVSGFQTGSISLSHHSWPWSIGFCFEVVAIWSINLWDNHQT